MPQYHFHTLRDGRRIEDLEGGCFESLEAATDEAVLALRELLGDELKSGRPISPTTIEIADETGKALKQVPYTRALGDRSDLR
ncbi:MAG: hypothetical protein JWL93_1377 [Hyphomicrobiales bacterium]|nr:hypothetical protein [Hyphomicrobiales bacterium]